MRRLPLVLLAFCAALGACTASSSRTGGPEPVRFDKAVEVVNESPYRIVVSYHRGGLGPVALGEVAPGGRTTFPLPAVPITSITAKDERGRPAGSDRHLSGQQLVRFRRIPAD